MTRRPLQGVLSTETCPECGNRLWLFRVGVSAPMHPAPTHVYICGRCDRPAEPGMEPRRLHAVTHEPIPEKPTSLYERDWFLLLLAIAVVAGAMKACGAW